MERERGGMRVKINKESVSVLTILVLFKLLWRKQYGQFGEKNA